MPVSNYEYTYYLDGSDACKVREENGIIEKTSYIYDGLKRLTQETVSVNDVITDAYTYAYDDYSNRIQMTASGTENYTTVYNYEDASGNYTALLQSETRTDEVEEIENPPLPLPQGNVKQTDYTYDANGSQLTKTTDDKTEANTYNAANQLVGFTDGDTIASYVYNADGLRIRKTVGNQTVQHIWDGAKQIIADVVDGEFYQATCYVRGTSLAATYEYVDAVKSEYVYYLQNAHGDVVNLTDDDGAVTKTYKYDAFGVEKNISDSDTNAFRYCGEYFDKETGTIYLRARYYNPFTGRFTQRDSFAGKQGEPLSLNLYTYGFNNPIRYTDPSGHFPGIAIVGFLLLAATPLVLTGCQDKKSTESSSHVSSSGGIHGGLGRSRGDINTAKSETSSQITTVPETTTQAPVTTTTPQEKINTLITKQQLESVFYEQDGYTVSWNGVSDKTVHELNEVLNKYDITTTERIAQFIGQCSIESHCGDWLTELGSEEYLQGKSYYPYYGAGYIQLTWESNYAAFSKDMNDPNIMNGATYVAEHYAWEAAGWFWKNVGMNSLIDNGASVFDVTQKVRGYDRDTWQMREQAYNSAKYALS